MPSKKIYLIAAATLFLIAGAVFWGIKQPEKANAPTIEQENAVATNPTDEIIYYYGETCSHCIELSKWLEDNKIAEKVNFSKKEVFDKKNSANLSEWEKKAAECGIKREGMGVPFIYARGKCYMGTPDAEAFFKQEAGI